MVFFDAAKLQGAFRTGRLSATIAWSVAQHTGR